MSKRTIGFAKTTINFTRNKYVTFEDHGFAWSLLPSQDAEILNEALFLRICTYNNNTSHMPNGASKLKVLTNSESYLQTEYMKKPRHT